jgi:hypothetical protein
LKGLRRSTITTSVETKTLLNQNIRIIYYIRFERYQFKEKMFRRVETYFKEKGCSYRLHSDTLKLWALLRSRHAAGKLKSREESIGWHTFTETGFSFSQITEITSKLGTAVGHKSLKLHNRNE